MATIIIGPDHFHTSVVCMTHSTLFGDIMTHSFSGTVTAMVTHTGILMDIIHGGDLTTPGIIILMEDLIPMYH